MELPQPALHDDPSPAKGGPDITVVESALMPESGPQGTFADIVDQQAPPIALYEVREGDTLGTIATMFKVSVNTIRWANDLSRNSSVKVGDTLIILPVSGVKHTVKAGDTVESIAKKYKADTGDIARFNDLELGVKLAVGSLVIVPDGEFVDTATPSLGKGASKLIDRGGQIIASSGFLNAPLRVYRKTQGLHGHNGVDLAASYGSPVYAAAGGDVIISRAGGWNGGYGSYVVIRHNNGVQTLYAHLSQNTVVSGARVDQGDQIGAIGSTGKSTGPHLHFEVRGAANPF